MPFPPYAYVPGHWPHPTRDPQGHSYGRPEITGRPLDDDPTTWGDNEVFVRALELFDHGYYWEAHEGLEALWIAAGREGPIADLLSALIKLAAAAIKLRQQKPDSAAKLFAQASERLRRREDPITRRARILATNTEGRRTELSPTAPVQVVFETRLGPIKPPGP